MVIGVGINPAEKRYILDMFSFFNSGTHLSGGIDRWLTEDTPDEVIIRLLEMSQAPLTFAQLNELLVRSSIAPVSEDFFIYYWLDIPVHPYDVTNLPKFESDYIFDRTEIKLDEVPSKNEIDLIVKKSNLEIVSLDHLYWGMYRIFMDGLLFFGNISMGYHDLSLMDLSEIKEFFSEFIYDIEKMVLRKEPIKLLSILPEDRHLISEAACKNLEPKDNILFKKLKKSYNNLVEGLIDKKKEIKDITIRDVVSNLSEIEESPNKKGKKSKMEEKEKKDREQKILDEFNTTLGSIYDRKIPDRKALDALLKEVVDSWRQARSKALSNTHKYLARIGELDVYVATSMRSIEHFLKMADLCDYLFNDDPEPNSNSEEKQIHKKLKNLYLRYFDPTMSAASGHEDKGLIECLMVKLAKVLILYTGDKDSYGKDAEAAMALSLGKPVIFLCEDEKRLNFYKNIHPLSRLIKFDTGVPSGAMICKDKEIAKKLLYRIFYNQLKYRMEQPERGYYRLIEKLTGSVVRVQTNDSNLAEAFWNHYHNY